MPFRTDLKGPFVRSANYLYPTTTGSLRIRYRFYLPLNGFAIKFVPIIGVQNRLVKSFFQIFSTGSIFHRARAACFIAPEICPIPWCAGRGRQPSPFRGDVSFPAGTKCLQSRTRSVFHRSGNLLHSVVRWTREDTFPVPQLCLAMPKASPAL